MMEKSENGLGKITPLLNLLSYLNGEFIRPVRKFCFMIIVMLFAGALTSGTCNATVTSPEVRVGSELEFAPYAFVDKSGRTTGFSIELIKAVTDTMGLSINILTGSWDTVWNALVAGQLDVLPIVAKLPERQRLVDFSLPHTQTYDAFFVRKGDIPIQNIAAAWGKEIVVMRSDAAHHEMRERNFQGKLILVDTIPEGLKLISSGKHNAFLCSKLIGTLSIKEHKLTGLTIGPTIPDYKRVFSFGVKKGDTELLEKLNQGLLIVKTNGEYDRIYIKWLTFDDPWRKAQKYLLPAVITVMAFGLIVGFWLVTLRRLVNNRTCELAEKNRMLLHAHDDLEARVQERTSELARANQLLQESELILNQVGEMAMVGGWELDAKTKEVHWTRETYRLHDVPEDEGVDLTKAILFFDEPDRSTFEAAIQRCMETGEPYDLELRYTSAKGRHLFAHTKGRGVKVDGKVLKLIGNFQDITDQKQAEHALRESERKYRELSTIDDLTQLYNSRHFFFQLKIELNRSNRYEQPLTLLLLDLDNFKAFNDTYGHIEGDQVLQRLGLVIKRCLRETDFAYRYGGEEFTILLPITTSADGAVIAERIRTEFKKEIFAAGSDKDVHMTASIGLGQYKTQEGMKEFVHRVDQLMYQAKNNGKDRVYSESYTKIKGIKHG